MDRGRSNALGQNNPAAADNKVRVFHVREVYKERGGITIRGSTEPGCIGAGLYSRSFILFFASSAHFESGSSWMYSFHACLAWSRNLYASRARARLKCGSR